MARAAHAMAKESPRVIADVIEIQEFPQLAQAYKVSGVPKTDINNAIEFTGAVPEETFIQHILKAVGENESEDAVTKDVSGQITPIA